MPSPNTTTEPVEYWMFADASGRPRPYIIDPPRWLRRLMVRAMIRVGWSMVRVRAEVVASV